VAETSLALCEREGLIDLLPWARFELARLLVRGCTGF